MQEYNAPIEDILFVINNLKSDIKNSNDEYSDPELLKQIFEEAGKFSTNVLAPGYFLVIFFFAFKKRSFEIFDISITVNQNLSFSLNYHDNSFLL